MDSNCITGGKTYFSLHIPKYEYQDPDGSYAYATAFCHVMCNYKEIFSTVIYYN